MLYNNKLFPLMGMYIYSMSYRLVMSNTICNRCDSSNTTIKETSYKDGGVDTHIYKVLCLDCGHEQ